MTRTTQYHIEETFRSLVREKGFSSVTVTMLVHQCGINRKTFYYHYDSLEDLATGILMRELKEACGDRNLKENWQEGLLETMQCLQKEQMLVENIFHSEARNLMYKRLSTWLDSLVKGTAEEAASVFQMQNPTADIKTEDLAYMRSMYTSVILGVLQNWIQNGMKEDAAFLVGVLASFFNHGMYSVLDYFQRKKNLQIKE